LEAALQVALRTMQGTRPSLSQRFHKVLATASGAAGGALGLASLPIELPVSTVIMLRSIAEIARSEGEDLSDPQAALSCMQVFALGGRAASVDASESGYFAVRAMLAKSVSQAARFVIERGALEEGAPVLVRFLAQVASRFGMVVSQKAAAQAIPLLGGLGGAAVNYAFIEHFQEVARAHFTVRRLERVYGSEIVRKEYERFARSHGAARARAGGSRSVLAKCRPPPGPHRLAEFEPSDRGARRPIPQFACLRLDPQQAYIRIR